ncbi:MAG: DUF177 domain-containing protein, partial [Acidocella sp.]|nr:DUF177 domain-containing protein [Acidocella sp.]
GGMEEPANQPPCLTRLIRASHIGADAQTQTVRATEAECMALARLCGLEAIARLRGDFILRHEGGGLIGATLSMQAAITQRCVVSLEPFAATIHETGRLRFVPERLMAAHEPEALDAETLESPDDIPFAGDMIDLGAALAEQLALVLDPYPRKPGAELPAPSQDAVETPFALLKFRKDKPDPA